MQNQYRKMKNLFLRQSYLDAWEDYQRSVRKLSFPQWDYIVLTASNEAQAESFRSQIKWRQEKGVLPLLTKYIVIPDPEGKRIGSGGATLQVLKVLSEEEGLEGDFHNKRILVIHSGGDSKRVPQYSVCGKLFSPVPRELPDGRASTLFDEFLIGMAGVPSRFKEGMLVLSGDVLLLFNPLQIDNQFNGAAAISIKSPVEVGKDHGVFLNDGNDYVKNFLHKQTVETLLEYGAVNEQGSVDIDTGAVLFDVDLMGALFSLIARNGIVIPEKYDQFVNERARISLYGDFLYPLAEDSTLAQFYKEKPEGTFCDELYQCRTEIWNKIHEYQLKLICLSPAEFIHFGTTRELHSLMTQELTDYEFLDWKSLVLTNRNLDAEQNTSALNLSLLEESVVLDQACYVENSWLQGETHLCEGAIASHVQLKNVEIPAYTVMHGVKLKEDGEYLVRIYGTQDNPKDSLEENGRFLQNNLQEFLKNNNLNVEDVWNGKDHTLWNAKLYVSYPTLQEAAEGALLISRMSSGVASEVEVKQWKESTRYSLQESFLLGDTSDFIGWNEELENRILVDRFLKKILNNEHYIDALKVFGVNEINEKQYMLLMEMAQKMPFSEKIRVYYAISRSMKYQAVKYGKKSYDEIEALCFGEIQKQIFAESVVNQQKHYKIAQDEVNVSLPVRVNWGGGWTDTPPYCNENGGVVLNAAIQLNGENPIEVTIRKIKKLHIEFASEDFGAFGKAETVAEIQDCHNPYDSFALHKAALIACGIIPIYGEADLQEILQNMGGGIYISTQVHNVPKGSGLGTSSILSGACVRAFSKFLGENWTDEEVYDLVLNLEQIMSTGGGWQDQVGGLTPGVKYITSRPGMKQNLKVEHVELDNETKAELDERFALIYTGQRRLARNLLRDVVGGYIGGNKNSVEALEEMKRLAVMMRFELEQGNVDAFAKLLNQHWDASKKLDSGSTNTCIDQIFASCEDLIDGKFISGAGGGGFLQVILKKGVTKEELRVRLHHVFQDSGVDIWNSTFVW